MTRASQQPPSKDVGPIPPDPDRGRGRLIPALLVSVALVVAGYFVGGRGGGPATGSEPVVTVVVEEPTVERVLDLEPVNVNLADGRYLRVGISMGIAHSEDESLDAAATGGEESITTEPVAPAADLVLATFAGRSFEELASAAGREKARSALRDGLQELYGDEVLTVFFTEFVMQ